MERLARVCDRISKAGGALSGVMIIAGLVLVLAEILLRTLLSKTLYIAEEYTGYLMAGTTFIALAYTLKDKSHIRMVFLHSILRGKKRLFLDIYAFFVGTLFGAVLTWSTFLFFWDSLINKSRSMQISETYLAIPQFFLPLGALLLTLQFGAELAGSVIRLIEGGGPENETESGTLGR